MAFSAARAVLWGVVARLPAKRAAQRAASANGATASGRVAVQQTGHLLYRRVACCGVRRRFSSPSSPLSELLLRSSAAAIPRRLAVSPVSATTRRHVILPSVHDHYARWLKGPIAEPSGARETAILGGGCFWGLQLALERLPGVASTSVGYMGGTVEAPSYEQVCMGVTGHAEVVMVSYDPTAIDYADLLRVFGELHDPWQAGGQGNDIGSQYRSAVFCMSEAQRQAAERWTTELSAAAHNAKPVATELVSAWTQPDTVRQTYWPAEAYHQQYLQKDGQDSAKGVCTSIHCYG